MRLRRRWVLLIPFCLAAASCNLETMDLHPDDSRPVPSAFSIAVVGKVSRDSIENTGNALNANLPRNLQDLAIDELPHFTVKIWRDPERFMTAFEEGGGRGGETRGYVNTERSPTMGYRSTG